MKSLCLTTLLVCAFAFTSTGADGISKKQADEIIKRLGALQETMAKSNQPRQLPPQAKVKVAEGPISIGSKTAPLVMVEFTDMQCPFCSRFNTTSFPEIKRAYIDTGKIRFVTRDQPGPLHAAAVPAAHAAHCAADQDHYWEMRDRMMNNQDKLNNDSFVAWAREFGMDVKAFTDCLASKKHTAVTRHAGDNGKPHGQTSTGSNLCLSVQPDDGRLGIE